LATGRIAAMGHIMEHCGIETNAALSLHCVGKLKLFGKNKNLI